ncbi:fibronectin type III-like domain-contianing protein [Paenibacillus sp. BIHB 4019]|uniref:fibronectin type III-like domain-contianing protein n=1 Tax=Paenibacillus sp. BIHB 4019 TaxID=1870819 RepID=UPI001F37FA58|nr:fibronectin type III-like domain-contianing protein [Paenibacillus sp. BIHB 4019]
MVRPNKELVGFKRISLQPGESKNVIFTLQMSQLAFLDKKMNWIVEAGKIDIMIGSALDDIRLQGQFTIVDGITLANSNRAFFAEGAVV